MSEENNQLTQDDLTDLDTAIMESVPSSEELNSGIQKKYSESFFTLIYIFTPTIIGINILLMDETISGTYASALIVFSGILAFVYGLMALLEDNKKNYIRRRIVEMAYLLPLLLFSFDRIIFQDREIILVEPDWITIIIPGTVSAIVVISGSVLGCIAWVVIKLNYKKY